MHPKKEKIAEAVKTARLQKGYTQLELSQLSGIGLRSIQRIENGAVQPRLYTVKALAGHLYLQFNSIELNSETPDQTIEKAERPKLNRQQKFIFTIGSGLLLLLASGAFLSQSVRFPETNFELFSFWTTITATYLLILIKIWK
jgi:transcriptional regulator with XRE-family HTH domain